MSAATATALPRRRLPIDLLAERRMFTPDLGRLVTSETLLSTFDVDAMTVEALLFQTGYLTIAETHEIPGRTECRVPTVHKPA